MSSGEAILLDGILTEPDYICEDCQTLWHFSPAGRETVWGKDEPLDIYHDRLQRIRPDITVTCPECGGEITHRNEYEL